MVDEHTEEAPKLAELSEAEPVKEAQPKIMCYISKKMVTIDETIEIPYDGNKSFRVMPKYIKYDPDTSED